jgi:hypothetical protein
METIENKKIKQLFQSDVQNRHENSSTKVDHVTKNTANIENGFVWVCTFWPIIGVEETERVVPQVSLDGVCTAVAEKKEYPPSSVNYLQN